MYSYQIYARAGVRYEFYPFSLECSMKETVSYKKRHLELLAFGKGGLTRDSVYVTGNGNFKIPNIYSDEERDKLCKLIWGEDTDFVRMEKEIKERLSTWGNLKKRGKLRMIDKYVLSLDCDFIEKKKMLKASSSALSCYTCLPQMTLFRRIMKLN